MKKYITEAPDVRLSKKNVYRRNDDKQWLNETHSQLIRYKFQLQVQFTLTTHAIQDRIHLHRTKTHVLSGSEFANTFTTPQSHSTIRENKPGFGQEQTVSVKY